MEITRRIFDAIKRKYPNCLLLFHIGTWYRLLYCDAAAASQCLGAMDGTTRIEFPDNVAPETIAELVHCGHRVVICTPTDRQGK